MSSVLAPPRATLADLASVEGKAELVAGEVARFVPAGHRPCVVAGGIYRRLAEYAEDHGRGEAFTHNLGYAVPEVSTGRESFSPDASYYTGPPPTDLMRFVEGPPDFAVEVRGEGDYGPAAELAVATKRAEYFEAGTRVVWDVDPVANVVHRYHAGVAAPTVFGPGTGADAEPADPGWRLPVEWLMA